MNKRRTRGRIIDGVLILDKPAGLTSNEALQQVKRLFNARKAGHTGSLDSLATGVLPLCFGEATKFSRFLLDADKWYQVTAKLGISTNTGDAEGEVLETRSFERVARDDLEQAVVRYRGEIEQTPPMFSAVKHQGKPLYKLAREGVEVDRTARLISIHRNEVTSFEQGRFSLDIHCSKGTYVRTIVADIGEDLGCGAHVVELRRTKVGPFTDRDAVTMDEIAAQRPELIDEFLLPTSSVVDEWPSIFLAGPSAYHLRHGQPVRVNQAVAAGWVKLCETIDGSHVKFLGVGEVLTDGRVAPRRLIA